KLRDQAAALPVEIRGLRERIATTEGKAAHMRQMTSQTIYLPARYAVTFSVETGHPIGACRHMSMSVDRADRVPRPRAVWMVAQELGFVGSIELCTVWLEQLQGHGQAVNLVQPIAAGGGHG